MPRNNWHLKNPKKSKTVCVALLAMLGTKKRTPF